MPNNYTHRLSIITVTFNAESVLEKTLASIFTQTYQDYELIIVDGKSTDSTVDIIKKHEDKISCWISEKDRGIYDAMNKAMAVAKGEYVQFLNAGDYYASQDTLAGIFSMTQEFTTLIYGDIYIKHLDGSETYQKARDFTLKNLLERGTGILCHQAMFVRRESAPLYDTRYKFKAELNWYFDLVELDKFSCSHHSIPVVYYSLGGFGHKYFIRNRIEWLRLVYDRYGLTTIYNNRILTFLISNSISRYPSLAKGVYYLKRKLRLFKG